MGVRLPRRRSGVHLAAFVQQFLRDEHLEDASEKGTIEIINTLGQKVAKKEFEGSYNAFIDLEDLPKCIYYYRYLSAKEHVGKIIKK